MTDFPPYRCPDCKGICGPTLCASCGSRFNDDTPEHLRPTLVCLGCGANDGAEHWADCPTAHAQEPRRAENAPYYALANDKNAVTVYASLTNADDPVNNPSHYTTGGIECIDAIEAALTPEQFQGFCRGNAIKYAWRAGRKGDAAEDLSKGAWYLNRAATAEREQ
jgi:hypothetical protein